MWEIKIPKTEPTVKEATLLKWHKEEGEEVKKGEVIVEVETYKATVELSSPEDGICYKRLVEEDETVPVGTVVAIIAKKSEKISSGVIENLSQTKETVGFLVSKNFSAKKVKAAPAARKLAQEKKIDLSLVKGSGPRGVITTRDVENYLQKKSFFSIKEARQLTSVRRTIAQRLTLSYQNIPQVSLHRKVDITQLVKIRKNINNQCNCQLSLVDFIIKALACTLKEYPEFNALFEEDAHKLIEEINIGLAIATDKGLVVPVIRNVRKKEIFEITQIRKNTTERALQGNLQPEDFEGGTFTLTNLGPLEIENFNPLINPPQVAILGIGKVEESLIRVENKEIKSRLSLPLSISFDHRIIDGAQGARFLQTLAEMLASPYRLLFKSNKRAIR